MDWKRWPEFSIPNNLENDKKFRMFGSLISVSGGKKESRFNESNVVRPTLLYIISQAVIPAKAGIQLKRLDSGSSPE
jgi:hypothetical protein